jgi:cytochrome c oxidase subunit 2
MGSSVVVMTGGGERTITVDEAYLRRSILDPAADVVKGFQPVMPVYKDLSPAEIDGLLDFLKRVK